MESLAGKTIVVTGATSGIGKATAKLLVRRGAHVILTYRDPDKAVSTNREMPSGPGSFEFLPANLDSVGGVKQAATGINAKHRRLDVLINNAGVWMTHRRINHDEIEMTFMVNHVAPFCLSWCLLDILKVGTPARIVNVNSGLYVNGHCDIDKTPTGLDFGKLKTYSNSKFCNMLATIEMAKHLEGSGVNVIAMHPGVIRTGLGDLPGPLGWLLSAAKRFWGHPTVPAECVAYVATAPELAAKNGVYFDEKCETPQIDRVRDAGLGVNLWKTTESIAGIRW